MVYIVRRGDTMWSIAQQFGVSPQAIMQANGITNPNMIYVGQSLIIPIQQYPPFPPGPPRPPLPPSDLDNRVRQLERQMERLEREVNQLERRVRRLEQGRTRTED